MIFFYDVQYLNEKIWFEIEIGNNYYEYLDSFWKENINKKQNFKESRNKILIVDIVSKQWLKIRQTCYIYISNIRIIPLNVYKFTNTNTKKKGRVMVKYVIRIKCLMLKWCLNKEITFKYNLIKFLKTK